MPEPNYKALLIGNGTFECDPHTLAPLKGPANDLRVLRDALTHPEFGLFDPANVRLLLDGTHSDVLKAMGPFFKGAGANDHLLFYYSGHGYPDRNNNLYLCVRDTLTTFLSTSAISDKTINLIAEESDARKYIFVLDCCHSGGFKGAPSGMELAHGSGRCLITACACDQLSRDAADGASTSTFTRFLAEALTNGGVDSDGDGIVLTSEVFKYVQPRVYQATRQTVQWSMDKTFGEAAIARAVPRPREVQPPPPPPPLEEKSRPMLEVSETRLEFRDVQPGEKLPVERIEVFNSGDGALDWIFESEEPWISAERKDDKLLVKLDTTQPGLRRGNLFVRDRGRGGSKTIRVLLQVVEPVVPRLVVSPATLEFGQHVVGQTPKLELRVSNAGAGRLQWEVESTPPNVVANRHEHGLTVEIAPGFVGRVKAPLRLKSNGGAVDVAISAATTPRRAEPPAPPPVLPPPPPPWPAPMDPLVQALQGWWANNAGAIKIRIEGDGLAYNDYNLMGIRVGQGSMRVQNGVAFVQGTNSFSGNYHGQFALHGHILNGSLMLMSGQAMPVSFMRQQPWFAAFAG